MTTIPIFFSFDNNYVNPAAVAFWSLLDRTRDGVFWEMWVLHHDISISNQKLLCGIVGDSGNGKLSFIDTGDFLHEEWGGGNWSGHQKGQKFTADTVVRCFGARFFPQYDKIIYSDVDVVFAEDVSELWEVDVSKVYLAGVRDAFLRFIPEELSHLSKTLFEMLKDKYLAGGIWVMNLGKIRQDGLEARMLEIIWDDSIVKRWNHQDLVNIASKGKVTFLPLNYIAYPYLLSRMREPGFVSDYTREELFDSVIHPKIIHYAGCKPWDSAGVGYDENWWAIADLLALELPRPKRVLTEDYERIRCKMKRYRTQARWAIVAGLSAVAVILAMIYGC